MAEPLLLGGGQQGRTDEWYRQQVLAQLDAEANARQAGTSPYTHDPSKAILDNVQMGRDEQARGDWSTHNNALQLSNQKYLDDLSAAYLAAREQAAAEAAARKGGGGGGKGKGGGGGATAPVSSPLPANPYTANDVISLTPPPAMPSWNTGGPQMPYDDPSALLTQNDRNRAQAQYIATGMFPAGVQHSNQPRLVGTAKPALPNTSLSPWMAPTATEPTKKKSTSWWSKAKTGAY